MRETMVGKIYRKGVYFLLVRIPRTYFCETVTLKRQLLTVAILLSFLVYSAAN